MGKNRLDSLFEAPAVPFVQRVLQLTELLQHRVARIVRDGDGRVVIGRHELFDIAKAVGHGVEHGAVGCQRHVLLEARGAKRGRPPGTPGIRRLLAAKYA